MDHQTDLVIDWQSIKTLTGYCRDDIKGFCEDEGFPLYPGRLHPFQALFLRNTLLYNWAVREEHFVFYWQAQQAFELFWFDLPDDIADGQLAESWIAWCEATRYLAKSVTIGHE